MSRTIHFYPHAGSRNHGCEAIVRTTSGLFERDNRLKLYTFRTEEDAAYGVAEKGLEMVPVGFKQYSLRHIRSAFHSRILKDKRYYIDAAFPALYTQKFNDRDVCISIGGDNYCYDNMVERLDRLDQLVEEAGGRHMVLWGCSIEPRLFDNPALIRDLKRFRWLVPRESLTYQAMVAAGLGAQAILAPDPAFLLPAVRRQLPDDFVVGNTVGINVSPLVMKRGKTPDIVYRNYHRLITEILSDTPMNVALIPHVIWAHEDDRQPLGQLYQEFRSTGRVLLVEDCGCMELKGFISACRFFVGARTHATIAAYSAGVPTLAVGYSVKARGIAIDLMGTDEGFVIPVQSMESEDELSRAFWRLTGQEEQIKCRLREVTADYGKRLTETAKRVLERT